MKPNKSNPPCPRCGIRHSPTEPCFDDHGEWIADAGRKSFRIILIGFGVLWVVSSIAAIMWKLHTLQP